VGFIRILEGETGEAPEHDDPTHGDPCRRSDPLDVGLRRERRSNVFDRVRCSSLLRVARVTWNYKYFLATRRLNKNVAALAIWSKSHSFVVFLSETVTLLYRNS
jgi:hypothetical protein